MRTTGYRYLAAIAAFSFALADTGRAAATSAVHDSTRTVAHRSSAARSALDTALARMGGADALRRIARVRFEMMTQWQRTAFDERPYPDQPSYEWHSDLRDYTIDAWRNTRRFLAGSTWRDFVDVVRDSVAIRRSFGGPGGVASPATVAPGTWVTLNIAYVDERRELFAFAPERLLLAAREARDLRELSDTIIAGVRHARLAATIEHVPATIFVRSSDGFLAAARFRASAPNDFGLVPFGEMDVEMWYSAWRKQPDGVVYPFQWDVRRVGRPYKRMSVVAATWNPPASPDSFVVSDSLRSAHHLGATRAMHDIPLDSVRSLGDGRFLSFGAPGSPAGAVKLGSQWVMLEAGHAPLSIERAAAWMTRSSPSEPIVAALVTIPATGSGGSAWLAEHRVPLHVGPGVKPFVGAALRGHRASEAGMTVVTRGQWLRAGGDSLWLEPIDLPDAPGAMLVYSPSLSWVYSGAAASPLYLDLIMARAKARGWKVTSFGSARSVMAPVAVAP